MGDRTNAARRAPAHYAKPPRELTRSEWPRLTPRPQASPAVLFCWSRPDGSDAGQRKIAKALALCLVADEARRLPEYRFWIAPLPTKEEATP